MYLGKMPKHTRQKKGRLEIRNIGLHEGGLYICQVIGKKLLYKGPSTYYVTSMGGGGVSEMMTLLYKLIE